jgi:hypothetical protein
MIQLLYGMVPYMMLIPHPHLPEQKHHLLFVVHTTLSHHHSTATDCCVMAPSRINPIYQNPTTVDDVYLLGKDMMNRGQLKLGSLGAGRSEDRRFREMFGLKAPAALDAWNRLCVHKLVPPGGMFFHFLWSLMFMKLYSVEVDLCANAGGSDGAVDPKTFRKWVWPFIKSLAELEYHVVRMNSFLFSFDHSCYLICPRSCLRTGTRATMEVIAC